ncbi:MAG: fused MFS/spermidine synthase [Myxococcaceae bacterium]
MSRGYVWAISFVSGACVMALELCASRVVSPWFGSSISVWANVIGLILLALAAGYFIGGRWAERSPSSATLAKVLLVAGALSAAIPFIAPSMAKTFTEALARVNGESLVRTGSFLLVALLFFAPMLLLGMVSPFAVKLLAKDHAGDTAGKVFALSTVGSLLGTFAPAFWLIPSFGTRATVMLASSLLMAVALPGLLEGRWRLLSPAPLMLVPLVAHWPMKPAQGQLAAVESPYQFIVVDEANGERALRFDDGRYAQSRERADTPFTGGYWDTLFGLPALTAAEKPKVLILGAGVGTAARGMIETRPEGALEVTAVELDPEVLELGRRYFSLGRLGDRLKLEVGDARHFLNRTRESYDLIFLDCYANERYVPPHLATQEFFSLAAEHLAPGGILVVNVNAATQGSPLVASFVQTMRQALPVVERFDVPKRWNRELIAAREPLQWERARGRLPESLKPKWDDLLTWRVDASGEGGMVLTDDRVPVEQLIDAEAMQGL